MEVLIHFIFQLFKIGILAFLYSFLWVKFLIIVKLFKPKLKVKEQMSYYITVYVLLLIFSFTYFGNHGLGDGPKIPIGYWETIENVNWQDYGYLEKVKSSDGKNIEIEKFLVENSKLCGKYGGFFYNYSHSYFVYNLYTKKLTEFETKLLYNKYANKNDLPKSNELLSFNKNYTNYWGGIRFLMYP